MIIFIKHIWKSDIGKIFKLSLSTIITGIIGFALVPLLTRLLKPEEYGQLNLFLSATNFIAAIVSFGLFEMYLRFYYENVDNTRILNGICTLGGTLICILVNVIIVLTKITIMESQDISTYIQIFLGTISIYYFKIITADYRYKGEIWKYTWITVLSAVTIKTLIIFCVIVGISYKWSMFIAVVSNFIFAILIIFCAKNTSIRIRQYKGFMQQYKYGLTAWPAALVLYGNNYLTQKMIQSIVGYHDLGIYNCTGIFTSIVNCAQVGLKNFWAPFVFKNWKEKKDFIEKIQKWAFVALCVFTILLIAFRFLIYRLIGIEYYDSKPIFGFVVVGVIYVAVAELGGIGVNIICKGYLVSVSMLTLIFTNVVVLLFALPIYGIIAAGVANMLSSLVYYMFLTFFGQKYFRTISSYKKEAFNVFILSMAAFLNFLCKNDLILFVVSLGLLLLLLAMYWSDLKILMGIVKKGR